MSPRIAEAILRDYLDRNRKPRLVIFEVTSLVAEQDLSTEFRTYVTVSPRLARLYSEDHPQAAVAARLFGLYPLNSDFYTEALRFMRRSDQDWAFHHTIPLAIQNSPSPYWTLEPREKNIAALIRVVSLLRERGIETRLVIAPYMRAGMPGKVPEFAAALTARLRAADPNVRLWDYVTAISDPKYFADRVHLNEDGSRLLLSMLQRDGAFANLPRDDKRPGQR